MPFILEHEVVMFKIECEGDNYTILIIDPSQSQPHFLAIERSDRIIDFLLLKFFY